MPHISIETPDQERPCPYCSQSLRIGEPAWRCDECQTVHHIDCWVEGEGCAIFGCANGGAARSQPVSPKSGAPVTVAAKPSGKAGALPPLTPAAPTPDNSRRTNQLLIAGIVTIVLATISIGAVIVATSGGDRAPTAGESAPASSESDVEQEPQETTPTDDGPPAETASESIQAVTETLRAYETAFDEQDEDALSELFTDNVVRRGFNPDRGGCVYDRGRSAVLDAYSGQFRTNPDTSSFRIVPLNGDMISLDSERSASTYDGLEYRFKGNGTAIAFKFRRVNSGDWKITLVRVSC